jgi:phthiocerol/phenolphthiocerol synthesis type-I polyketide synthase E
MAEMAEMAQKAEMDTAPGIAVVGLAARFPGAADAASFWRNVREGVESISRFTAAELAAAGVDAAEISDPRYVPAKGVLAGADLFDAAFFGFTPREAEVMDPQHRVFLECAWEALEDAGCDPRRRPGRIGVWAGSGASSYLVANLLPARERLQAMGALQVLLLNDRDFLATRAAYALDLKGPGVSVQTACSTSLVAVHMACQSLLAGECDVALAGGVAVSVPLRAGYLYQEGGVLSPDGHCRAFDAAAAGSVEGNGCGVVVLARLADALAGGDRIYAVIRGSAVNNDGAARAGFTAPSLEGQAEVIAESLMMAGVEPRSIGYVEAHGSGTALGDPIEVAALEQAFRATRSAAAGGGPGRCALGSVKTNIGHCNTAAGVAGLIKAVLALAHRTLPPSLHFTAPNPRLDLRDGPFYVPATATPWKAGEVPRRAGVSSFGLGGTNAHVVLEEAPPAAPGEPPLRPWQLLPLSARTPAALEQAAARLAARLGNRLGARAAAPGPGEADDESRQRRLAGGRGAEGDREGRGDDTSGDAQSAGDQGAYLADVAWTLQTGRRAFAERSFVVARDLAGAHAALAGAAASPAPAGGDGTEADPRRAGAGGRRAVSGRREGAGARPVVFLFPGLGDQVPGMAAEIYRCESVFRDEVDRCAELLVPWLGADLREVMLAPPAAGPAPNGRAVAPPAAGPAPDGGAAPPAGPGPDLRALLRRAGPPPQDPAAARLERTLFAQPACFVVEYALARLLMSWGIEPQALIGYSLGEYVAACIAGSITLDQALALVAQRARRIDELPGGAMIAIPFGEEEARPLLGADTCLAATNGPHFTVAGGPAAAIQDLERRLAAAGASSVRIRTTHAFHSAMMEPAAAEVSRIARAVLGGPMRPPRIPWISNLTGAWITAGDLADADYWARHLRGTVRFAEGVGELLAEPERVFVEVGPGATLGTLVKQHPAAAANRLAVATLQRPTAEGSEIEQLLDAVGRLWLAGVEVDWQRFQGGARRRVALPTYPFERQRYWIEPPPDAAKGAGAAASNLTDGGAAPDLADWFWVPSWRRLPRPLSAPPPGEGAPGEHWLVFVDDATARLAETMAGLLRGAGFAVTTAAPGGELSATAADAFTLDPARPGDYEALLTALRRGRGLPVTILHLWGLTAAEPSFAAAQQAGLASVTLLAQAIAAAGGTAPVRLAIVANGLAEVVDGDPIHPAKTTVLGALKVFHQELPRLFATAIDTALPPPGSAAERRLAAQLLAELAGPGEDLALPAVTPSPPPELLVALRGRQRFVRVFEPVRLPPPPPPPFEPQLLVRGGVYFIAGAAAGPGMAIAEHLVRRHEARVGLLLPDELPPRTGWEAWQPPPGVPPAQDAVGAAIRRLLALERGPGLDRVLIARGAAGDGEALRSALAATRERFGPPLGAFWTGGAFAGGLLQLKTPRTLALALEPVARGAEALLDAMAEIAKIAATGPDPAAAGAAPFVVLCSTTTAVTGGLGLLEGAAAGCFLEALALRRAADPQRVTTVHWDPYQWGGWLVAGTAAGMAGMAPAEVAAALAAHGVADERSAAALERLLAQPLPAAIVAARGLPGLMAETDSVTAEALAAQMTPAAGESAARPALATPYEPPQGELEEQIAALWQELFGIQPIGRDDGFLDLGGHSLLAIQIVTQLRHRLEADLPVTALFEAPTVAALARAVRRARGEVDPVELESLLALVEGLSPEEAAARLGEMEV